MVLYCTLRMKVHSNITVRKGLWTLSNYCQFSTFQHTELSNQNIKQTLCYIEIDSTLVCMLKQFGQGYCRDWEGIIWSNSFPSVAVGGQVAAWSSRRSITFMTRFWSLGIFMGRVWPNITLRCLGTKNINIMLKFIRELHMRMSFSYFIRVYLINLLCYFFNV